MEFDWRKLYKMKLGEFLYPDNKSKVTRVPGGWVYSDMRSCCFIPFDNEFQNNPTRDEG